MSTVIGSSCVENAIASRTVCEDNGIIGCLVKGFRFDLRGHAVLDVLAGPEEDRPAAALGRIRVVGAGEGPLYG